MNENIIIKLGKASVGSCSCMTKSDVLQFHKEGCLYRVLCEAINEIADLRQQLENEGKFRREIRQELENIVSEME